MTRRDTIRTLALLILVLAAFAVRPEVADAAGYWTCSQGRWVAVGHVAHPRPLKACGVELKIPKSEAGCKQAGGSWGPAGIFPQPICRLPTHDAGRTCGDGAECEGLCLAKPSKAERARILKRIKVAMTGTCTSVIPVFGCMAMVKMGYVSGIMCLD